MTDSNELPSFRYSWRWADNSRLWRPGLLGRFLKALDETPALLRDAALARLMTKRMAPGSYERRGDGDDSGSGPCLIGTALPGVGKALRPEQLACQSVEQNYDWACWRFGTARVNAAIRDRVFRLDAARRLAAAPRAVEQDDNAVPHLSTLEET